MEATTLIIALISLIAFIAWITNNSNGFWLLRRHIGLTCPHCNGMGTTEDEGICPMCHGSRIIWNRRY